MNHNDGQRRIDAKDTYAPFVVRSAWRLDPERPEPHVGWYALIGAAIIVLAFVAAHLALPVVQFIVQPAEVPVTF